VGDKGEGREQRVEEESRKHGEEHGGESEDKGWEGMQAFEATGRGGEEGQRDEVRVVERSPGGIRRLGRSGAGNREQALYLDEGSRGDGEDTEEGGGEGGYWVGCSR
jgi:hypothetical protein